MSLTGRLGRYELITQIGQGGMASVQLAIQRGPAGFEKRVVIKLVHEHLATQKTFVDMLLDEAKMAAMVKHPNVVDIYDLGEAEGRYFIAMEYLEGEPLLAVLRAGREGKRLDVLSTARLIADTAEGLHAAHELRTLAGEAIELVHHDISLGNIVVLYNGQVKLVDFGVAKATQSAGPHVRVQGKFSYMAPEKLEGAPGDRRSDIWSLGCVLWEALTLRRLFKGGNDTETMRLVLETTIVAPSTVNSDVPRDFDAIVMKALDRDPANRYATAKQMAVALEDALRDHKYGGKNDLIARYMQATFADHLGARKKLLQEVTNKGKASDAVLHAAFVEPRMPRATIPPAELSVRIRRQTGELLTDEEVQQRRRRDSTGQSRLLQPQAPVVTMPGSGTSTPAPRRNPRTLIAIGGGVLLALVIVLAIVLGGGAETAAPPTTAKVEVAAPVVPDTKQAEELFRTGMQLYAKGDAKAAVVTFRRAAQADAHFAPAWRALGLAHERLGEWGQAKTALEKYLELAPEAPDAAQIRERIGTL